MRGIRKLTKRSFFCRELNFLRKKIFLRFFFLYFQYFGYNLNFKQQIFFIEQIELVFIKLVEKKIITRQYKPQIRKKFFIKIFTNIYSKS